MTAFDEPCAQARTMRFHAAVKRFGDRMAKMGKDGDAHSVIQQTRSRRRYGRDGSWMTELAAGINAIDVRLSWVRHHLAASRESRRCAKQRKLFLAGSGG